MSLETDLLEVVSKNRVDEVVKILQSNQGMINLQCRDTEGRTPLIISILEGYIDVITALLKHGAYIGDSLLVAVEVQYVAAVEALCNYSETEKVKEIGKDFVNGFPTGTNFPPGSTPLQMAAILNDYAIVKVLLDHDARMPSLKAVIARTNVDSFERALAQLQWYQAIASQAYLLLASEDPMEAAFWLADRLRIMSTTVPQLKVDYEDLSASLEQFVTRLLGFARNLDEIEAVLGAQRFVTDPNAEIAPARDALPVRIREAIHFEFKTFVANSTCQDYMLSRWYSSNHETWRKLSSFKMAAVSTLVMFTWPILCALYILVPSGTMVDFIRTPYVRFLLHTGSRLTFLILLLICPVTSMYFMPITSSDGQTVITYRVHERFSLNRPLPWLINVWIISMTWREMKVIWRSGMKIYFKNHWNWLTFFQQAFYLVYLALSLVTMVKVDHAYHDLLSDGVIEEPSDFQQMAQACMTSERRVPENGLPASCMPVNANGSSLDSVPIIVWSPYDPIFVAEAAFAIANVLTQLSLLNAVAAISLVGPLQISLGGMMRDIGKFMLLFGIVLVAFSLGMTQIFRTYAMVQKASCMSRDCELHAFGSFGNSIETLFWSLFDLMDLENLKIDPNLSFTQAMGTVLYVSYSVVAVVVMMNALIAMMSNTYTRVEENSDVEWKVARTELMTEYLSESSTIPPPLNLLPSARRLVELYEYLVTMIKSPLAGHRRKEAGKNFQQDGYKSIVKKLVQRFLWQEKILRARLKHKDKVQTELLHLKDAVEMASHSHGGSVRRRRHRTIRSSMRDPYLRGFYKQTAASGDNITVQDIESII